MSTKEKTLSNMLFQSQKKSNRKKLWRVKGKRKKKKETVAKNPGNQYDLLRWVLV